MFRRSTSTAHPTPLFAGDGADEGPAVGTAGDLDTSGDRSVSGPRHARRARRREAVDDAALRARVERVHRRLAEVGSVQVTGRVDAIDNDTARRDPLTRPFASPFPAAVAGHPPARRSVTAPLPRPA